MSAAKRDTERDTWLCGYAAALAAVRRLYHEDTIVEQVLHADGLSLLVLKKAGVEAFDLDEIRKAIPPAMRRRRTTRRR